MMFAMHAQISRVRAERMLDAAQAAAYPHMGKGASRWFNELLDRASGVVSWTGEQLERLHWNGKVVSIASFKAKAGEQWGRKAAR